MLTWNNPKVSLEAKYPKVLRIALILTLVIVTSVLVAVPKLPEKKVIIQESVVEIQNVEIPQTQQYQRPPSPRRPTVPVASEAEDIAEDVTIAETTFDEFVVSNVAPPPPPEESPRIKFIPYDEPPEIIGGIEALRRNVIYPELAKEAGIEGTVVVQAYINEEGVVDDMVIVRGLPKTGLDEAAMEAVKKTWFKPAKQRDRVVGVWYSIPIVFKLQTSS